MILNFNKKIKKVQKIKNKYNIFNIDLSFIFILVFALFLDEIKFYIFYILSLLLHELSHFFVSKKLGYFPKKIKLNFFGAVLEGDDDFVLKDELKIILAGPLFNFFVIIFCYLSFWFYPESYICLYDILIANWSILLFNLLPIFPLDMGRIILNALSKKYDRTKAIKKARNISLMFIFLLFFMFILSSFFTFNFSLGLTSVNLLCLLFSRCEDTSYKRQLFVDRKFKLLKKGLLERVVYVSDSLSNYSLFKFIDDNHFNKFVFLDSKYKKVKELTEIDFYYQMGFFD